MITRQLAVMIKVGIPILQGLKALESQIENPVLQKTLVRIRHDVEGGSSFSEALGRHPRIFSELYVNSVAAAEKGGVLDHILVRLAEMMQQDRETINDIKEALRYPIVVSVAMTGAVLFMVMFVVPRFAQVYSRAKAELPLPTQMMMMISGFLLHSWPLCLGAAGALFVGLQWYVQTRLGRYLWDQFKLRVPIFGPLVHKTIIVRFSSLLMFLYTSGLPIVKSLDVVSRAIGNVVMAREISFLIRSVQEGKGLARGMEQLKFFPPLVRLMISVGETSGSLETMLASIVEYYEPEVRTAIRNMTSLIEPLLTAVMGVVILGIALAVFLPMWGLMNVLRR